MAYRMLVVEDEADTRELLDIMQRWEGHHVDTAAGGLKRSNFSPGIATT